MNATTTADDSTDSESFEPPFPENSRGYARIEDLQPFHLEDETYVERDNADIVASIEEHGFREGERVVICPDGTILLGHRRVDGADQYGMERVPVYVEDVDPESAEAKSIFVSSNQYRDKTPGEQVNEAEILEEIEGERAEERQGSREDITQNFAEGSKGEAREKAAEQIGFSRESYRKGKYVKESAQEGNDTAEAEWQDLMKGDQSIHGAYTIVREMEEPDEDDEDGGGADDGGDGEGDPDDTDTDSTDEDPDSDDGSDDDDGSEELDYPEEIWDWVHSHKSTGAVYGATADFDVYSLVQVVLEERDSGWQVYVDGPGPTDRVVVCSGVEYTTAADEMLGYLDDTKPDEARDSIDTEETRADADSESTDLPDVTNEGDPFHGEQNTEQQVQQPATDGADDEGDPSDTKSEETASEGTGGDDSVEEQRIGKLVEKVSELEAEKERAEEKAEAYLGNLQDLSRQNIDMLTSPSPDELLATLREIVNAVDDKDVEKTQRLAGQAEDRFDL